jgi:oxygen-independent coproporphyrinogen-3 oxidase
MGGYTVPTIYIGGGTPSWLDAELIIAILQEITKYFQVEQDAEISIECNPGTVTAAKLKSYRQAGINRLSIGLQSADNEELKVLGRIHTYEQFLKTYELARYAGYSNINIDLMSGIPYQNLEKFLRSLQQVVRLRPEHISAYSLIVEKGTPFYDRYKFDAVAQQAGIRTEILPDEDEVYRINKATQDILTQAGYEQYEISNYARSGYACRHNIGYWTRENYLGMGLGASSLIENVRYSNIRNLYEYMKICEELTILPPEHFAGEEKAAMPEGDWFGSNLHLSAEVVDRKSQIEEFMFLGLRMNAGVTRADFERNFGVPIEAVYLEVLTQMKKQQMIVMSEGRIALTDRGMDLANYVMAKFLL